MERMTNDRPNRSGYPWPITLDQCAEREAGAGMLGRMLKLNFATEAPNPFVIG
jgi:hypothetical protein